MVQGYRFRPDTPVIIRPKQQMTEQERYSGYTHWLPEVGDSASVIQNGVHLNFYWLPEIASVYKWRLF
jgi:hypothetical protein